MPNHLNEAPPPAACTCPPLASTAAIDIAQTSRTRAAERQSRSLCMSVPRNGDKQADRRAGRATRANGLVDTISIARQVFPLRTRSNRQGRPERQEKERSKLLGIPGVLG